MRYRTHPRIRHRLTNLVVVAAAAIGAVAAVPAKPAAASAEASIKASAETSVDAYRAETGSRVRVNQVGYLPSGPKFATLVTGATQPVAWRLTDATGTAVVIGNSTPRGIDPSSGQNVHTIDFSDYRREGSGYTLTADGQASLPFDIGAAAYLRLRTDSLSFYYPQRSGIEIRDDIAPGYARAAGHAARSPHGGDTRAACQPDTCQYTLDVRGGWYDAGDHGKYVVNGGVAAYQLMSLYERSKAATRLGDGTLRIPEHGAARVPDVLDEVRWELDFMLRMQVPAGKPLAGMAHHKVGDAAWTELPLVPAADTQRRLLSPPSTAATLNLAATAAQGARLFRPYDTAFAGRLLASARTAWAAALANPERYAPETDGLGSGAYADGNVADEFYWAAAELYLSTGEPEFRDHVLASPLHTADVLGPSGFDWKNTAAIGRLDLAAVPSELPDRAHVRQSIVDAAVRHVATAAKQGYGLPYAPADGEFGWGSNSLALNNMVVLATAYDITGDEKFRDGALGGMDYILGRNALNQSYVTGYGPRASHRQHSRWYANQLDPKLPSPPPGTLAGGPNSSIQDPLAAQTLKGCKPQFCYRDDIRSWSTNELTINWNSALAWMAAFAAEQE